ncbi:hypothetical protein ACH42_08485 [Endozoicomonas sp. (ex Bugula neritina AB1)]|nr:hypothetical protein ACH42_08485 [Endozoicomonas sp. (ex Bugula neritina AB1)]
MTINLSDEWFTAQEIAGLPLMPTADRSIRRMDLSPRRPRSKGKGYEYHISSLPKETQRALKVSQTKKQQAETGKVNDINSAALKGQLAVMGEEGSQKAHELQKTIAFNNLSSKEQTRVRARSEVLAAWEMYITDFEAVEMATRQFVEDFNRNQLKLCEQTRIFVPKVSRSTLMRWRQAYAEQGPAGLSAGYKGVKVSLMDSQPELLAFAEAVLAKMPHTKPGNLLELMQGEFDLRDDVRLPSHRTLISWMSRWKVQNKRLFTAVANPDAYKNKYMVAAGDARERIVRLHQRWELDSSPADVMCTDGRFSLISCVDVFSASAILMVRKSSDSYGIALTIRQAILQWGMSGDPEKEWGVDNGKDYASYFIQGVADSLGVKLAFTDPFAGEQKPFVERFFKRFAHNMVESLPGFIGHNVAERKAIEAQFSFADRLKRKAGSSKNVIEVSMSSEELQAFCDRWTNIYMHTKHSGINGKTPAQMVQEWVEPLHRIEDERVLDLLLEPIPGNKGERTVQKKGIKLDGGWYIATELGARVGDRIQVRYDAADAGRIYVFELSGAFVCMAQNPSITGVSRRDIVLAMKEHEKERIGEQKKALKAKGRKLNQMELVEKAMAAKERKIAAQQVNVTALPKRSHSLSTDHIDGALSALNEADQQTATHNEHFDETGAATPEMIGAMEHVMQSRIASSAGKSETDTDRFQRWIKLHEAMERGETLNEMDKKWKERHEQTSEWKGNMMVYESFGKEAFGMRD